MSRAVIYCRVSTVAQEDNTSLDTQEQGAREYCAGRGYGVIAAFRDVHTGADMNRPGLNAALDTIKDGTANVLVVYKLDRLSRSQIHQAVIFYRAVEQYGARIESVTEEIDNSPMGQFLRQAAGMVAEVERENTRERTIRGKRARAEQGKLIPGSFPPYGYVFADEKRTAFIPDEETAPIVRRMYQDIAKGGTLRALTLSLQAQNIPTPTQHAMSIGTLPQGRKVSPHWHPSTVSQILKNPAYKGEPVAYRWRGKGVLRAINDPARIPLPASVCPPLVDTATWEMVQQQFERNRQQALRNTRSPEIALLRAGYAVCGHCGTSMFVEYRKRKNLAYYVCNRRKSSPIFRHPCEYCTRINARELDAAVLARIAALARHPEAIQQAAEQARQIASEQQAEIQDRINTLDKLIARDTAGLAKLLRSLESLDEEPRNALTPRINELSKQIQTYKAERDTLQRSLNAESNTLLLERGLLLNLEQIADAPYEFKRQLLHALGVVVAVYVPNHPLGRWRMVFKWTGLNEHIASTAS